jgi:hypothetical protein
MTRIEFSRIMAPLVGLFTNANFSEERANIYFSVLDFLGPDALMVAVTRALRECKWFPRPAELIELAGANPTSSAKAEAAFEVVSRARDQLSMYESVNFGPLINRVVRQLGGWPEICNHAEEEWSKWTRKTFLEVYVAFVRTIEDGPDHLPGDTEIQNQRRIVNGLRPYTVKVIQLVPNEALALKE